MSRGIAARPLAAFGGIAASAALVFAGAGCELKRGEGENLVEGKEQFIAKCGSCHTMQRAGTKGASGPNLDHAFQQARASGLKTSTIRGVVHDQILYPALDGPMPPKLVTGQTARDVAAYVGAAAARPGEDTGPLADVGKVKQKPLAKAEGGTLEIDADPTGQLLYVFKDAEAPAGGLTLKSKNDSSVDHNIAVSGSGVDEKGPVGKGGATSQVQVDLKPGKYDFLCTVPGHAQAGMRGALTVK
ncbi:MAG TPA: plastocyanin/azurin family copper-binding protein [Solirubrobacteraceae bacterium]|nr:plastocyanin/azurin family copper-binding protein [Solirubrobacteraceae bacterium]